MVKFFLLSLITFGIYAIVALSNVSEDINQVASPRDGKHTMHYCLIFFIFSWLTCGIVPLVWLHRLCNRMGDELKARELPYSIDAMTFWGWGFLGSLIVVGPFVFYHKFFKAINLINKDYNEKKA